jgi:hypothetical protein
VFKTLNNVVSLILLIFIIFFIQFDLQFGDQALLGPALLGASVCNDTPNRKGASSHAPNTLVPAPLSVLIMLSILEHSECLQQAQPLRLFLILVTGAAAPPFHLHRPRIWSPLPPIASLAAGGRGTLFLRFEGRVRACLLCCVVGMMGVVPGQINLPQLHSHTGGDLHGSISELMEMCACRSQHNFLYVCNIIEAF